MRIVVCIPIHRQAEAMFVSSAMNMASRFLMSDIKLGGRPARAELWTCVYTSADLAANRNGLAEKALEWGATHILWADADHLFPDYTLVRLLSLNLPVVGCNYPTRLPPFLPTALGLDGRAVATTEDLARAGEVEAVAALGLGLCLMRADLFAKLPRPWFAFADGMSEDRRFFRLLAEARVPVHVDHQLSWEVGHIGAHTLTNADVGPSAASPPQDELG
jgi:hypothetical protein